MDEARRVRDFWFGQAPLTARSLEQRVRFWFGSEPSPLRERRDAEIKRQFGTLFERAAAGELGAWADGPRRRLSLILLLDQFSRNMFRGTARAFATDQAALTLTLTGMLAAADAALGGVERLFFYMPLQHAESSEAQEESVVAYQRLSSEAPLELHTIYAGALRSAENHRAIIARFGRFPHRNLALGRESSDEEKEWLSKGGSLFGQ